MRYLVMRKSGRSLVLDAKSGREAKDKANLRIKSRDVAEWAQPCKCKGRKAHR